MKKIIYKGKKLYYEVECKKYMYGNEYHTYFYETNKPMERIRKTTFFIPYYVEKNPNQLLFILEWDVESFENSKKFLRQLLDEQFYKLKRKKEIKKGTIKL